jgi:long-subunit acyl-CoA synthetase (AMP-forming)
VKNGDCVCVFSFNTLDYPVLVNGIVGFGGVYTGCNPSYTAFELVHHLRSSHAQIVVVEPELLNTCLKAADEVGIPRNRILLFADKGGPAEKEHGLKSWRELFEHGEMDWPVFDNEATAKNTTAALLYSSGTTGKC